MSDSDNRRFGRLLARIRALDAWLRAEKRRRWNRDLPLGELLGDRWERARQLGFGKGASIYHDAYVFGDVSVGEQTWVGPFTILDGSGGLRIGRFCSISAGVQIYTHDSVRWALSGGRTPYVHAPVLIGDYCYIGPQAIIASGVTIGERSIVAAGAFVKQNVPERSIVGGRPARRLGRVEGDADDLRLAYGDDA